MDRPHRSAARTIPLLLLAFAGPAFGQAPEPAGASTHSGAPPNVILVMTDDQGYGPMGSHGHPWIRTPHLDSLEAKSVTFERFLVSPTCAPTRSALMTGRHPMRNGVTHTILERERMTLDATTLPQALKTAGYTSAIFGKWHLGDEDAYQPGARGFDEVFIHGAGGIGQAYKCSCADAPGNKYFDPVVRHNGTFVKTSGFCTDVFFDAALDWIEEVHDDEAPFFAYIATNAPHGPFIAPPENRERFEAMGFKPKVAGFYGMIENIDENMGRLEQTLARLDLHRDTMVIFMSDNGMTGGGSGNGVLGKDASGNELKPFNAGMRGLKGSVDEGGVRVPFLVRWDGQVEAGRSVSNVAAHIDLFPTLMDLAGVDAGAYPEDQVEGRSLMGLIRGDDDGPWEDRYLYSHRGRWKTGADPNDSKFKGCSVRSARFRFVNNQKLYDMLADPGQTTDVAAEHPEEIAKMRAAYDAWWDATVPMMVNEDAPMSPTWPYHEAYAAQEAAGGIPAWAPKHASASRDVFDFSAPPAGATVLVGETAHAMVPEAEGESQWTFSGGVLTASPAWDSVVTPETYGDFRMHLEFNVNNAPGDKRESNGNSGVYIQQRYEIQILNSHGVSAEEYQAWDCASLYRLKKPDQPACRPAGEWQSYDIVFRAARFAGESKTENARITVLQNGIVVHDAFELPRKTGAGKVEGPEPLPVKLQGHHNPVRFRNVWIERLDLTEFPKTPTAPR